MSYSSEGVTEQHNPQGATGWVGEGWSLGLGQISWSEVNETSSTGTATWQDTWQLSDPYGTSAELIPPNTSISTYYDNTSHGSGSFANPVQWHASPDDHLKVYAYNGPISIGDSSGITPPCWRVWLTNGLMEEYGCTQDSLQYYINASTHHPVVTNWFLNLIADPRGNQIQVTYRSDQEQDSNGNWYPRDVVPATIAWDSPGGLDSQHRCQGSSWQPLMQVNFGTDHTPVRLTNSPSNCNTATSVRCDDPKDLSGSGGLAAPQVESTFVLNDIQVQTRTCPSGTCGSWNTLRDVQLSYEQSGPGQIADPATNLQESTAGYLDLTKIQQVGDDGSTTLPATSLSYTSVPEYYEDLSFHPASTSNCGPTWNTGTSQTGGCVLWSTTYDGNSRYLQHLYNGNNLGEDFFWANARNNTHGVPSGQSPADPLYCTNHQTNTYPCNAADDGNWSHVSLTERHSYAQRVSQNGQGGTVTNTWVTSVWQYTYSLSYPLAAQECGDCVAGMYWGNQKDQDYLDFYNGKFMGFTKIAVSNPDGSIETHWLYQTEGYGVYDTNQISGCASTCHSAAWWDLGNVAHGQPFEVDYTDTNGTTPLKKITYQYTTTCPPNGASGSPANGYGSWDGKLVAEADPENPVASCEVHTSQEDDYLQDGSTSSSVPHATTAYVYDGYGRMTKQTETTNDGGVTSPTTIVTNTQYIWNDNVTATTTSATGTYLISFVAGWDTESSDGTVRVNCPNVQYDGQSFTTGQSSGLTKGLQTDAVQYTSCGTAANGWVNGTPIHTSVGFDGWGNPQTTLDADANGGISGHTGCTINGSAASSGCTGWDSTFHALPTSTANALGQTVTKGYTFSAAGGFGLWPTSVTDANGQTTTTTLDAAGRPVSVTEPGETSGLTTQTFAYTVWCTAGTAGTPCDEYDQTQRIDNTTTVTQREFYDGFGNVIETRTPATGGQDVVQYAVYDVAGHKVAESEPYYVTAYTGSPGSAAFSPPDSTQPVTTDTYDGLDRVTSETDALSHTTTTNYQMDCGYNNDAACYSGEHVRDANGHLVIHFRDAFGRRIYDEWFTGSSGNDAPYSHLQYTYDLADRETQVLREDGSHTSTSTFDAANRVTSLTDPDLGTLSMTYDGNGNLLSRTDPRGTTGTVYHCYDGVDRPIKFLTSSDCTSTTTLATYTYDSTTGGNPGIGKLTSESFTSGTSATPISGSYSYTFDVRGRETGWTQTMTGGTPASFSYTYNDGANRLN